MFGNMAIIMHPNLWHQVSIDMTNGNIPNALSKLYEDKIWRARQEENREAQYPVQWHRIVLILKRGGYINLGSNNRDYSNYGSIRLNKSVYELRYTDESVRVFATSKELITYLKTSQRQISFGDYSYIWEQHD